MRVHTDSRAAEFARSFNALAYTVGQNVVFGHGQFSPQSTEGKRLLAHELAHVVQQATARTSPPHLQRAPDDQPQPRRDVAIVGEDWEGAEQLAIVLAGGGAVHNVTSMDEAAAALAAIDYPVGTLYFITHSTVSGDLQFGTSEKMIDPDRIGRKFRGLIADENAPQRVDFRGCSVGTDPKAMEKIRKALGAQSVIGGTCYAVIELSTAIKIGGKPVTKPSDVRESNPPFAVMFENTARNFGDAEKCIVSREEKDFFAAGGRFVALWFNPELTGDWVPGESVCYNEVIPQVVDPKAPATAVDNCELIVVEAKSATSEPAPESPAPAPESTQPPTPNE